MTGHRPFTAEQREELRASVDRSRREALAESERLRGVARSRRATVAAKPPVVRAAEKAQRAQQAVEIVREVIVERPTRSGWCVYCGAPAASGVCHAHSDLAGAL